MTFSKLSTCTTLANTPGRRPRWLHRPPMDTKWRTFEVDCLPHTCSADKDTPSHTMTIRLTDCSPKRPSLHDALWKHDVITGESLGALNVGYAVRRSQFLASTAGIALTRNIVDCDGWDRCRVSALLGCHVGSPLRLPGGHFNMKILLCFISVCCIVESPQNICFNC
jgi:hypothetical protein